MPTTSTTFSTICKRAYKPLVNDNDEVIIANLGAIRLGLQALQREDADDYARAEVLWAQARDLLIKEVENNEGGAQSQVVVSDDFMMEAMCCDGWPLPGYGG